MRTGRDCCITLKDAKERCRALIGRLPRCGREVLVLRGTVDDYCIWTDDRRIEGEFEFEVILENSAGRYRVREHRSLLPVQEGRF